MNAGVGMLAALLLFASCEPAPSKSDYVSDRVSVECADTNREQRAPCRLEVIKKYMDVPLEQMQQRFPPPAPH